MGPRGKVSVLASVLLKEFYSADQNYITCVNQSLPTESWKKQVQARGTYFKVTTTFHWPPENTMELPVSLLFSDTSQYQNPLNILLGHFGSGELFIYLFQTHT